MPSADVAGKLRASVWLLQVDPGLFLEDLPAPDPPEMPTPSSSQGPRNLQVLLASLLPSRTLQFSSLHASMCQGCKVCSTATAVS